MPKKPVPSDSSSHLAQAKLNERLAIGLIGLDAPYQDWVMTMLFYSALHYASSKAKQFPKEHNEAILFIFEEFGTPAAQAYMALQNKSYNARYLPHIAEEYRNSTDIVEVAMGNLSDFKKHIGIK